MNGVAPRFVPFNPENGGVPDLHEIERAIGPKTRALVLISPNNPTGAVYPDAFLQAAFDLCRAAGIALVLDETYRDFMPTDGPPHGLFQRKDWESTLVHLYSFSKVFCLTGHRVGAVVGAPALLEQIAKAMDCVAICAPRLGQIAAEWGLQHLEAWRRSNTERMRDRLDAFKAAFAGGRDEIVSAGAYFAYLRHPHPNQGSTAVARRLADRQNLLTLPGRHVRPGPGGIPAPGLRQCRSQRGAGDSDAPRGGRARPVLRLRTSIPANQRSGTMAQVGHWLSE